MYKSRLLMALAVSALSITTLVVAPARAQVSLTGTTFSENFDGLPNSGGPTILSSNPQIGTQFALSGTSFVATETTGSTGTFQFIFDNGNSGTGAVLSLGATGSTERALGSLASGSTIVTFGVQIVNNTGSAISRVDLAGFAEQYRSSTVIQNIINAQFFIGTGTGAVTNSNFLTANGFTDLDSFDLVGDAPVTTNGVITPTSTAISAAITTEIAAGDSLFLRFVDTNDNGNDAAIGLDGFTLTATPVPEPTTILALSAAGLGALRLVRRRVIG